MKSSFVFAAALALVLAQPAFAHVTVDAPDAKAGSTFKVVLRVPHGCDGAATTSIRIQVPDGLFNAKPMPKTGWELSTVKGAYPKAYASHGSEVSEGTTEIEWSGGELPDDWYDEFTFRASVDPDIAEGTVLHVPVLQGCGEAEEAWIEVDGGEEAEYPAPTLTILAPDEHHHH